MKATIYSDKTIIGTADLKICDKSMGAISSKFIPHENYLKIRDKIQHFNTSDKKDYKNWFDLKITAQLENGCFLHPIGGIMIYDIPEFDIDEINIDIAGLFSYIIEDYFISDPPRIFVEEPWEEITIDQKIAFEKELRIELGIENESHNRLKNSKNHHILANYEFSALCKNCRNDDVLFSINPNKDTGYELALVHLTWSQKQENENYPKTELYKDFDDFRNNKMIPDSIEWEE